MFLINVIFLLLPYAATSTELYKKDDLKISKNSKCLHSTSYDYAEYIASLKAIFLYLKNIRYITFVLLI